MFYIKFCVNCNWSFGDFLKIHITFYNYIQNIINCNNVQKKYLSIELLQNFLAAFFVEKARFLSNFFSDSEFGMRVYKGKMEARNESIFLYTFLRISPRKINILKNPKLGLRELNELNDMNVKRMLLNLTNILKSKQWKCQKNENFEPSYLYKKLSYANTF